MRISDWSSDVCSSDLSAHARPYHGRWTSHWIDSARCIPCNHASVRNPSMAMELPAVPLRPRKADCRSASILLPSSSRGYQGVSLLLTLPPGFTPRSYSPTTASPSSLSCYEAFTSSPISYLLCFLFFFFFTFFFLFFSSLSLHI